MYDLDLAVKITQMERVLLSSLSYELKTLDKDEN